MIDPDRSHLQARHSPFPLPPVLLFSPAEPYCLDPSRARRSVNGAARSIRFAPVLAVSLRGDGPPLGARLSCPRRFGINRPNEENNVMSSERQDVYTRITNKIIADLEQGVRTWMKPWNAGNTAGRITRPLRHNGVAYSGINILMLWAEAMDKGFAAPIWMTFKQALELQANVRKGEKGSLVVYANAITRTEEGDNGEETEREIHYMKGYTVFNVEQIDGLPGQYYGKPEAPTTLIARITHAEDFFKATKADIRYPGDRAFYSQDGDYIQMPVIEAFRDAESFYATLAHESAHWTKHPARLDRSFNRKAWGDEGYAREELVAELASAFLCADLGLTPEVRDDHASYIANWLTVLKNDNRAIFGAAAHAQRAVDYLHGLKGKDEEWAT
jgi:antirestriction protein ArdC